MTREEAIQCIKHELLITVNRKDLTGQAIGEALDMAIEALQAEPCEDVISRQAAIEALGECPYNWIDTEAEAQAVDDWEFYKATIEALPSAQTDKRYENGIIDVSEALEYCKRAAEVNKKLMMESLKTDKEERNPQQLAWSILANQFFTQQYTEWDIYVPNMIKGLADGTWKDHFEEDDNA